VFDMDGTLLHGSACLDLSYRAGHRVRVDEMEERWALGQLGHLEFYELLLPLWSDLDEADIEEVFVASRWIPGIADVWADIAARSEHSAVITLSPQFFVDRLLRWGVSSAHGAPVHAAEPLDPAAVLTPQRKVEITMELLDRYGLTPEEGVAYGDSDSDVPLFETLPNTIAVNGSDALKAVAAVVYDGWDLREAYAAGRRLLERSGDVAR
jgi:phosphoserine phosphatase